MVSNPFEKGPPGHCWKNGFDGQGVAQREYQQIFRPQLQSSVQEAMAA